MRSAGSISGRGGSRVVVLCFENIRAGLGRWEVDAVARTAPAGAVILPVADAEALDVLESASDAGAVRQAFVPFAHDGKRWATHVALAAERRITP